MAEGEVGNKQPNRPLLPRKNYAMATPSEDDTPRTLIQGLLEATSVSQSTRLVAKKRPRITKSPSLSLPQKRRSLRKSIGDNATPRTLIKNILIEASPETPLVIPHKTIAEDSAHEEKKDEERLLHVDVIKETDSPLPLLEQANNKNLQKNIQPNETKNIECEITEQAMPTEDESSTGNTSDIFTPQPAIDSIEESNNTQDREQDDFMPTDNLTNQWNKSKWKDLVTPCLPVTTRKVLHEANKVNSDHSRRKHSTTINKKKAINRAAVRKRTSSANVGLPSSLVKSIFEHFSKSRVNKETLQIIQKGSNLFFKQLSGDLMAFCQHAGRATIETRDVELLMKRSLAIVPFSSKKMGNHHICHPFPVCINAVVFLIERMAPFVVEESNRT